MTANQFDFYSRTEYFEALVSRIDSTKRGDRVAVATMTLDARPPLVMQLIQSLTAAAGRGAEVYLAVDAYTFLSREDSFIPGPLWRHRTIPQNLPEPYATQLTCLQTLAEHGGHYTITNMPARRFSVPPKGRSHIKGAVVNDYLYIGGCNLESPQDIDIMIGQTNLKAADWIYEWFTTMVKTGSTKRTFGGHDQSLHLANAVDLLIDSGVPKQSIIYDQAMQLIDTAEQSIFFTCQYFPGGKTAQHLLAAHKRGVQVRIVFSHPHRHGKKALAHHAYNARERLRLPAEFFAYRQPKYAPRLHAKVIATEKGAIVGSNNYVTQGVLLGTAEIAMRYDDPSFARQVIQKIEIQL